MARAYGAGGMQDANLWDVSSAATIIMTQRGARAAFQQRLRDKGVEVVEFDFLTPDKVAQYCYKRGYLQVGCCSGLSSAACAILEGPINIDSHSAIQETASPAGVTLLSLYSCGTCLVCCQAHGRGMSGCIKRGGGVFPTALLATQQTAMQLPECWTRWHRCYGSAVASWQLQQSQTAPSTRPWPSSPPSWWAACRRPLPLGSSAMWR